MSLQYGILGFLIILLALAYLLDRRYMHIDRQIKKIDAQKNYSEIIEII